MAWRPLPPRLRHRTPTVHPLEALPAIVLTPLAAVVWVGWPFALAALTLGRGDRLLGAVFVVVAAVWTVGIVRERHLVAGTLLAWPASVWSAIQQWRGRVDTEDLEEGRFVPLTEHREPDAAERATLDVLVAATGIPALQRQAEQAEVIAECLCGCPSIRLLSHVPAVPPGETGEDPLKRLEVAALGTTSGDREVLLRLRVALGTVRELEVTAGGVHDGSVDEIPPASTLRLSQ